MASILFRWRDWGATKGKVTVSPLSWSKEPDTWVVPKPISLRVEGEARVDLTPYEGRPAEFTLNPDGLAPSHTFVALIPPGDEVNSVDLVPVDRSSLEPLGEGDALTAAEILAQASSSANDARGYVVASREYAQEASSAASEASSSASAASSSAVTASDASLASQRASQDSADHASRAAVSALSVMPMLSGSVTITPRGGALAVDLGQAVNVVTGLAGAGGTVDVIFPPVTTPDGRVDPDGLGTLLHVDSGADKLTWPGGTVVHGTPPVGQAAMASLVRVGGAVIVVWPPDVVPTAGEGVAAQIAEIEQIIGGEVEVQPGGIVMKEARPRSGAFGGGPAVFMNPHSVPTSDELVLTVGTVDQTLEIGDGESLSVRTVTRAGGLKDYNLRATVTLDPPGEPVQNMDGWLVAVAPGPAYGDARVTAALRAIDLRLPSSKVVPFTDGTWGVVLLYVEEDPNWYTFPWGDEVELYYDVKGQPWGSHGMTWTSDLGLPMDVRTSSYESLGITLPGTFHRKAELEAMGVRLG